MRSANSAIVTPSTGSRVRSFGVRFGVLAAVVFAGVMGVSAAAYAADAHADNKANGGNAKTDDSYGAADGNQILAPVQVPVNVACNAVGALVGEAKAACKHVVPTTKPPKTTTPPSTTPVSTSKPVTKTPMKPVKHALPVTGAPVAIMITAAVVLVGAGIAMVVIARRRRSNGVVA
jgi:hypothetical protein